LSTGISEALITGLLPQVLVFITGTGGSWFAAVESLFTVPFLQDEKHKNVASNTNSVFAGSSFILRFGFVVLYDWFCKNY
jgi:hypothetical protein